MAITALPIIDLNAELAKLTMFRGLTLQTTFAERRGSGTVMRPCRDGILFASKVAGTTHWEDHPQDELVHVLDGMKTLDIVCDGGPKSFPLRAGMIAIVPKGAWHRFRSPEGGTTTWSLTFPGDHIELDVNDPRSAAPEKVVATGTPSIIDLDGQVAKLTMFRGRTPRSTMADRQGSAVRLASYRDGVLSATKFAGKGHWERHIADELIHILDGSATLELVLDDGPPQSFALRAGMIAVNPQGAWHRFQSADGVTLMTATPLPSEVIEDDVDDPRMAERQLA
jgi:mannose-6-phosphate isomerase-like protein (cupin superfamily)